jgi:hypothetical protein
VTIEFLSWADLADLASSEEWEEPEVVFPGREPKHGQPHWLVVEEHPDDGFTVEHTEDCIDQYGEFGCDVRFHELEVGLDSFFHRADLDEKGDGYTDGVRPGRYLIVAWSTRYYSYGYGSEEYDSGLRLIYPEEAM